MGSTVVIVGGGYGGAALAKELDADFDVVLIDPKDSFVHAVAALRGLVDEQWADRMYFDFAGLLTRGRHVRDRVVSVDAHGVTTSGGERVEADYIVLASGSSYPYPAKLDVDDTAAARARQAVTRGQLAASRSVLLVGAGPVGLELAGEITDRWPGKKVSVVDVNDDILGGRYLPGLRAALREQLTARGVTLVLGSPLTAPPPAEPGIRRPFAASTADGRRIEADIWFRCHGVTPASGYLTGELARARGANGFLEVDDFLQVAGARRVFAIGDITAVPEPKRSKAASEHAVVVAANIRALAAGRRPGTVYRPGPPAVLVPLGAAGGASQVPGPEGPVVLDAAATARYKSGDLLVGRYAGLFGVPPRAG
ncbi:FAD-dependent oxidoreductase [Streptomyces sp. DW26H14]|uniref:FAD-dependent oxidoreductase n=1 Tax=Streptomyces sp. DW26H14 TaxID=3435395 RepID=UPI00403D8C12